MFYASLLSFASGFLSLSIEILWIRLFGFANHSLPQTFAFVLMWFLVGIALGAFIGKQACRLHWPLWELSGIALLLATLLIMFGPYLYANYFSSVNQLWMSAFLITATAALIAIVFPIAHHLSVKQFSAPIIAKIYAMNILGATLGPLFTGQLLLNWLTLQQAFAIFACFAFFMSFFCFLKKISPLFLCSSTLVAAYIFGWGFSGNAHWLIAAVDPSRQWLIKIIENAHGIITIYRGGKQGDIIAGGNVYDGRTNLDPTIQSNAINRVIVLSALHDQPRRILMIGLSIGTWLKIVTAFPNVDAIDVVEINPGYIEAIANYPIQQSALHDPRVHLYLDDGRRWLKAHPQKKYDIIIANTTFYWRAYSTNLLSYEFFSLLKQHMNHRAILAFNTTYSLDAAYTAATLFNHAYLYQNFMIAADFDWREKMHSQDAVRKLMNLQLDQQFLFSRDQQSLVEDFLHLPLRKVTILPAQYQSFGRHIELVTDANLITEYQYGKVL